MSTLPAHDPQTETHPAPADPLALVVRARPRDLGGFTVRRVLPSHELRMVGPFIFWDHMGPAEFAPGTGIDVRPHPHINLATLTYLFEGEIDHKDSLGSAQTIRPRAVNWMVAGRGIAHSERTGPEARRRGARLHGIQSWIALPRASEEVEPSFHHVPEAAIPVVTAPGVALRVVAGSAFGATSPVPVFSPLFDVEARLDAGAEIALPDEYEERAAYVVEGAVVCGGERVEEGAMAIARPSSRGSRGSRVTVRAVGPSRVMLLGGAPLDGERHIFWNFVSSSEERIEAAKRDWKLGRFAKVPGDLDEFIPLPE